MVPHILIVDDDKVVMEILTDCIKSYNYTFDTARNGREALEKVGQDRFHILLTDLVMPEMEGDMLIDRVYVERPDIVSVIMSVQTDLKRIVTLMNKNNTYEYLIKPFDTKILKNAIDKAFDRYLMRVKENVLQEREKQMYNDFVQTMDWKMELRSQKTESIANSLLHQMNISFFQGQGIGALLSTVGMALHSAKLIEGTDKYEVDRVLVTLLKENYDHSMSMVRCFLDTQKIIAQTELYKDVNTVAGLKVIAEQCVAEMADALLIKGQSISISEMPASMVTKNMVMHKENFGMALKELLINAMKYSNEKDKIYIIFFHKNEHLEIKVLNPSVSGEKQVIDGKNESLIFEPFYRLSPHVDERFDEQFKYGLGLTVVKKIIDMHGANISIYSIKNSIEKDSRKKQDVCVTLRFPLH